MPEVSGGDRFLGEKDPDVVTTQFFKTFVDINGHLRSNCSAVDF